MPRPRLLRNVALPLAIALASFAVSFRLLRYLFPTPVPSRPGRWLQENPLRRRLLPPEAVVRAMGVQPGQVALEIGAGTGRFTVAAARALQPGGTLFTLDLQGPMVAALHRRLSAGKVGNVAVMLGDARALDFADAQLDLVFLVSTLGEIRDKSRVLAEVYRVLKPGGRLCVTEALFDLDYLPRPLVARLARRAGFVEEGGTGPFWRYTLNFRKPT